MSKTSWSQELNKTFNQLEGRERSASRRPGLRARLDTDIRHATAFKNNDISSFSQRVDRPQWQSNKHKTYCRCLHLLTESKNVFNSTGNWRTQHEDERIIFCLIVGLFVCSASLLSVNRGTKPRSTETRRSSQKPWAVHYLLLCRLFLHRIMLFIFGPPSRFKHVLRFQKKIRK